jgi:predicted MFS family arabinose efflux permease
MTAASEQRGPVANADFLKLWTGQSISAFGSLFGALALTALVYLHASPAQMGLLAGAEGVPVLLFALFAGVWVDRLRRRPVMIIADLGRALLLLTVPLAAASGHLLIEQLYVVAFGVSMLGLGFDLSYRAYLPDLVAPEQILDANSRLQVSESVAEVGSPAIGGAIVQAAGGPVAVLVDALTFLGSAASVALIRKPEPKPVPAEGASVMNEIHEGLRAVWNDRILRAMAGAAAVFRFAGGFFAALYGVFLIRTLGLSPLAMGITIGAGGIGALGGALVTGAASRRLGTGPAIIASRLALLSASLLIVFASGPKELAFAMICAAQLLGDPFWAAYEIITLSLRQSITPPRLLGRVNSTMHLLEAGLQPVGSLVAGGLAEAIGVRQTIGVGVAIGSIGLLWLLASPVVRLREPVTVVDSESLSARPHDFVVGP